MEKFENLSDSKKREDCIQIKKNDKKFSLFQHYKKLNEIINSIQ